MKATAFARETKTAIEPTTTRMVRQPLSLVRPGTRESPQHATPVHITPRQMEVLALLCEGLPNKLICRRLNISAGTVKAHISSILRELGVGSRAIAGVLDPDVAQRPAVVAVVAAAVSDRGGGR